MSIFLNFQTIYFYNDKYIIITINILGNTEKNNRQNRETNYVEKRVKGTEYNRFIQRSLNYFGFNAGTIDGIMGPKTKNAILEFKKYADMELTNSLSKQEAKVLYECRKSSQSSGESSLADKRKTLNYCVSNDLQKKSDMKKELQSTVYHDDSALWNTITIFYMEQRPSMKNRDILSSLKVVSSNNSDSPKYNLPTLFDFLNDTVDFTYETEESPDVKKVLSITPYLSGANELTFNLKYLDKTKKYTLNAMTLNQDDAMALIDGLNTVIRFQNIAESEEIYEKFTKQVSCFPSSECGKSKIRTEVYYKQTGRGDEVKSYIIDFKKEENFSSVFSYDENNRLLSYLDFLNNLHKDEFGRNDYSKEDLEQIFK
jgi:hypothetical protein